MKWLWYHWWSWPVAFFMTYFGWWTGVCFPHRLKVNVPVAPGHDRFCCHCRYLLPRRSFPFGRRTDLDLAKCSHPTSIRDAQDFLVRGYLHEDNMGYASIQRRSGSPSLLKYMPDGYRVDGIEITNPSNCGPEGRYWEHR